MLKTKKENKTNKANKEEKVGSILENPKPKPKPELKEGFIKVKYDTGNIPSGILSVGKDEKTKELIYFRPNEVKIVPESKLIDQYIEGGFLKIVE